MQYLDNILFLIFLVIGLGNFTKGMRRIYHNISKGQEISPILHQKKRWLLVLKVALGQGRMNDKPWLGFLHFLVYIGFFIINIEVVEILIDGIFGTHRFFSSLFPIKFYQIFTLILEILAVLTAVVVLIFFIRRNILKVPRLAHKDLKGWAKLDANFILIMEFLIMWAFLQTNAADSLLQSRGLYVQQGLFPISEWIFSEGLEGFGSETLIFIERFSWWFHFVGILFFLNYLCYSKHLHIFFAFPNIWYSFKEKKAEMKPIKSITQEIKASQIPHSGNLSPVEIPPKFGAEDVFDLDKIQLLNAYSCVECGRCTEVCPAQMTGKKLSPRKVMMSVRDRMEELDKNPQSSQTLLHHYISSEEIWACTTCNACAEVCPLYIDPVSVILEMRRYLVMEQSSAPQELHKMMMNMESYAAPWAYSTYERENWNE